MTTVFYRFFFESPGEIIETNKIHVPIARAIKNIGCFDPNAPIIKKKLTVTADKNFPKTVIFYFLSSDYKVIIKRH